MVGRCYECGGEHDSNNSELEELIVCRCGHVYKWINRSGAEEFAEGIDETNYDTYMRGLPSIMTVIERNKKSWASRIG